jgi:multicomponent Na+:H+ antiporter subunit D
VTALLPTALPPAVVLFALAVITDRLPRRLGHVLAVLVSLSLAAWLLTVPAGLHLRTTLFGFEVVLFAVDIYSRLLGVTLAFVATVGVGYTFAVGDDRRQTALALAYVGAGLGVAFAGDWLSLVVFWELMAVCATVFVWYRTSDRRSGVRYAIYHELGALALIAGVVTHYVAVGTFLFGDGVTPGLPALLVALGIGLNACFLGLHVWLVDTYPRTHVATSVVLAAVTTKVGVYTIVRAFPDGQPALAYVGGGMVLFGVTLAVLQSDMRRLLSYHIVSQVGYMVAGFGVGGALADAGAMAHLVNNVLYKSLLFMVAGVVIVRSGEESLKDVGGLARTMPKTAVVFAVAVFSIAGLPGFNGFISKGMVIDGVENAGFQALWWMLVLGGVGTVLSFAKFGYYAFLHGDPSGDYDDLRPTELAVLGSVASLCVVLGVAPSLLFDLLPASGVAAAKPFSPTQFLKAGAVTVTGLVVFAATYARLGTIRPVPDLDSVYHPLGRRLATAATAGAVAIDAAIDAVGRTFALAAYRLLNGRAGGEPTSSSIGFGVLALAVTFVVLLALFFVL